MNTKELQAVMQKWADQCGSKLLINATNKRGHESAFSFVWSKPLWVLGEEGWEIEDDAGQNILICTSEDGEMFIGPDVAEEDEGYSMVLIMDTPEEVDQALELLWFGSASLFENPMPENMEGTHLGELREWFELNFTPEDDECCCEDDECVECEGECECEHDHMIESRMITIATEATPKASAHCPVCGKSAAPNSCAHLLFINENSDRLSYISADFAKELEERGVAIENFTSDPEQLRDDDSWDSDYLFFDILQIADDAEMGFNQYVGFRCKW